MTTKKKLRGMSIDLPAWWLEDANKLAEKGSGWTQERLADALTDVARRAEAWDHKTVGNFLKGDHTTIEMMEAFLGLFDGLLPCQFTARTRDEALRMNVIARRNDPDETRTTRRAALDRGLEQHEKLAADQTARLESRDETRGRGRGRARGVGRGRPAPQGS